MMQGGIFVYMGEGGPRLPDDVVHVRVDPSVTMIHAEAFKDRTKLEDVELHEGLLEIRHTAFRNCTSLKRMEIPSTVTLIGASAFCNCSALGKVHLQEGIEEIGEYAFQDCDLLKHIHIPTTLKRIGWF